MPTLFYRQRRIGEFAIQEDGTLRLTRSEPGFDKIIQKFFDAEVYLFRERYGYSNWKGTENIDLFTRKAYSLVEEGWFASTDEIKKLDPPREASFPKLPSTQRTPPQTSSIKQRPGMTQIIIIRADGKKQRYWVKAGGAEDFKNQKISEGSQVEEDSEESPFIDPQIVLEFTKFAQVMENIVQTLVSHRTKGSIVGNISSIYSLPSESYDYYGKIKISSPEPSKRENNLRTISSNFQLENKDDKIIIVVDGVEVPVELV